MPSSRRNTGRIVPSSPIVNVSDTTLQSPPVGYCDYCYLGDVRAHSEHTGELVSSLTLRTDSNAVSDAFYEWTPRNSRAVRPSVDISADMFVDMVLVAEKLRGRLGLTVDGRIIIHSMAPLSERERIVSSDFRYGSVESIADDYSVFGFYF